ncbi:MAG: pyridoxamine 5'-phosphate oxidase-like FMN-binding protein [Promethearchaeota archaeon CR_4]|nr:MAG: pyridoxamine 5'-phosphate oxidase-like FMN-binding protein [Candidatus Lokiarchaeota archaeon CR_4]
MEEEQVKEQAKAVIEKSDFVFLSTLDEEGFPHIRALFNFHNKIKFPKQLKTIESYKEEFVIYLGTNTSSEKVEVIRRNPKTSLYYYVSEDRLSGLTLTGFMEVVQDQRIKNALWEDGWERYYLKGVTDPDYTILKFKPTTLKLYYALNTDTIKFG